jgi:hypothetical protein
MSEELASHLTGKARAALELPIEERIKYVRMDRWVGYDKAKEALDKLEDLLTYPRTDRMPNLLLVSDTNNGKTTIVNRFQRKLHPPYDNPDGDGIIYPVMIVQAPPVPDESRLLDSILEKFSAPYRERDKPGKKLSQVITISKHVGLLLLIIDEIHNVLAGSSRLQHNFRNVIRYLGNELKMPIVAVGTREALNAINTDPQLTNRFEPFFLPRWTVGDGKKPGVDPYLRLLTSFEGIIPLKKPSNLADPRDPALALKLLGMSEGLLGELTMLLKKAAVSAIRSGKECIDAKVLDQVGWIQPSDRRKVTGAKTPAPAVKTA